MFTIDQFRSEINTGGVLKTNKFMVEIPVPASLRPYTTDKISLRCEAVQWPGVSFATLDTPPRAGYGATEVIPYAPIFEDVTLNFIVDRNSETHKFFFNWINKIVNLQSEGQTKFKNGAFEVGYKDDYKSDIQIHVYNDIGTGEVNSPMTATLYRAFPRALPGFDLNWANNDEVMKLNVQFTYTDYFIKYSTPTSNTA
jgi:hypothetical protein